MTAISLPSVELLALVENLVHACLGAPEDELRAPYDEGCRAIAELRLDVDDRAWIDGELRRIGKHFDLR
ncbi:MULTISPECIES: hypothetical protein [Luteimonas]|uniref:hypothetical protein n=1 Tax=Luteimonas TaxID=83614 RepID=UPI000C7B5FD3|nr:MULTISPECIES: hypothetical protein [Luteimonas]